MNTAKQLRVVLGPAIDAARAALRDLDDEDVPQRLRAIAKRGDGKLPVPLVAALLNRIDEDEWFRSKALEAFERRGGDAPVSGAYLRRDAGWWMTVSGAVTEAVSGDLEEQIRRLERDVEEMRVRSRSNRAKLKASRKASDEAEAAARTMIGDRLGPLKTAVSDARSERDRAEARAEQLRAEIEDARADRFEAERMAASLVDQVRRARREIADLRRLADEGPVESLPRDPIERARWLDRTAAMVAPYREAGDTADGAAPDVAAGTLRLPTGIAPDSAEAIDALKGVDGVVVLIDGHNLLGVLDASTMATGRARRGLIAVLGRLVRHLGSASVEVVFDSALQDGRAVSTSDAGVVVRFAPEELIADDVIVELADEHGTAAVVISDDREVRERSARHGATVLWAQALADWL
jgi:TolA-binding protein